MLRNRLQVFRLTLRVDVVPVSQGQIEHAASACFMEVTNGALDERLRAVLVGKRRPTGFLRVPPKHLRVGNQHLRRPGSGVHATSLVAVDDQARDLSPMPMLVYWRILPSVEIPLINDPSSQKRLPGQHPAIENDNNWLIA